MDYYTLWFFDISEGRSGPFFHVIKYSACENLPQNWPENEDNRPFETSWKNYMVTQKIVIIKERL
jgi:hypothetical protein